MTQPDKRGYFGTFGGRYVPEALVKPLTGLENAWITSQKDVAFQRELESLSKTWVGRPTPLYEAVRLSAKLGGATIALKREDLAHTGAHKINNGLGQALLARRLGKKRIVAETGAGQHGVAAAAACALVGLDCIVYMGEDDVRRQALNVLRMKLFGAEVRPVSSGTRTLKDAVNEAIRDWIANADTTYYLLGSVVGPHPYPAIVRDFQTVIGRETREQSLGRYGRLPECIVACVGGGSNSIGIFYPFLKDKKVKLIGVEAAGRGLDTGEHAASLVAGKVGVLHGAKSYVLQDDFGQISPAHSLAAGLDYPGVGPEHAWLKETGRASYVSATDDEALDGFKLLAETEGILPALESAHAVYYATKLAPGMKKGELLVVNLSGRGDKDLDIVSGALYNPSFRGRQRKAEKSGGRTATGRKVQP